jgi:hypothetical protein
VSLRDLLVLYGVIGVACAIAVLRRGEGVLSAAMTLPLWPVWAPFALATKKNARTPSAEGGPLARIDKALDEAVRAVAGTPMADVFSQKVASRIQAEVANVAARLDELVTLAAEGGLDVAASKERLRDLEARGAPERAVATARMQHESLARLEQLVATDRRALEELADLLEALRTQLLLARFEGSSAEGASAIVSEVWARLEGLGAAFEGSAAQA